VYNQIIAAESSGLLCYWRAMLANYNAANGPDWISWFCQQNSGTYDNQWMIVDLKLFTPGMSTLPANLLWIAEVVPGVCMSADVTSTLTTQGYWASYNIPYFPYLYQISGFAAEYKKNGDEYSYSQCSRAKIFARDAPNVTDYAGFQSLMDSNNYVNDPYSNGQADEAIMARGDLIKGFPVPTGAIDSKTSNYAKAMAMACDAKQGPTHQSLPVFQWSEFTKVPHAGQPDSFDFDYVVMSPANAQRSQFPYAQQTSAAPSVRPSNSFSGRDPLPIPAVEVM